MAQTEKNFSVLGDSISTFQGFSPWGADHYSPDLAAATGVATVEDTWWMQVIRALGGTSLSNLSIAGNIRQLASEGKTPDHILLYAGLNDANFYIPPQVFQGEYALLLARLREAYPQVRVHCGTLLLGAVNGDQSSMRCFVERLTPYNDAIRAAVAQEDAHLVDLAALGVRYTALDAFHPTGQGMRQLAGLWLRAMGEEAGK